MGDIVDLLIEKALSEMVGWLVTFFLGSVFAYAARKDITRYLKNAKVFIHDKGISMEIIASSKGFSGTSDNVFNSLERKFRSFEFRKTRVTKGLSPEKDKYVLSNFKVDPIRSVEISLVNVPDDSGEELVVEQVKVMISARISQHDNDRHFDVIRELMKQVEGILGCGFNSEYAFVINIPKGREFMEFEGIKGYEFICIDAIKKGKKIRIADQQMVIYSEFDNAVQNLINELSIMIS